LHTHLTGRQIIFHHYRNGTELPPILSEPYYDFNYQEFTTLLTERQVLPGDELMVECVYDTAGRTGPTKFGPATTDEMCLAYVLYYPKLPTANESCVFGDYTNISNSHGFVNKTAYCGSTLVSDWQGPNITQEYHAPECVYNPPPVQPTAPLLVDSLNKSIYQMNTVLDPAGNYKLYWTLDRENLLIHAGVEVKTAGWVGFGISPAGMQGSDIMIGWVKDGQAYFADRFAFAKALPPPDQYQDLFDVTAGEYTTSQGLTEAQLFGIVVGSGVVGIGLIAILIIYLFRRSRQSKDYHALGGQGTYGGTQEKSDRTNILLENEANKKESVAL